MPDEKKPIDPTDGPADLTENYDEIRKLRDTKVRVTTEVKMKPKGVGMLIGLEEFLPPEPKQ